MPALDVLHLKGQLNLDLDSTFWQRYISYFVDSGGGRYSAGDEWILRSEQPQEPDGGPAVEAFSRSEFERNQTIRTVESPSYVSQEHKLTGAEFTSKLRRLLQMSENYYVAPEMHVLVSAAATSLPDDTIVEAHHLPSPQGFMIIPGSGIVMLDIRGKKCATNGIVWDTYGGRVHLTYLVNKSNPVDAHNTQLRDLSDEHFAALPQLTPWSFGEIGLGKSLPKYLGLGELPPELSDVMHIEWDTDKVRYSIPDEYKHLAEGVELNAVLQVEPTVKWFVAAVNLMKQTLVSLSDVPVDRATRRRLQRVNLDARATIIALRKREGRQLGQSTFEYSHRFLRRGHWRQQAYKEVKGGEWLHRPTWIHDQIVGPEDKPLVVREHVNALIQ